MRRVHHGHAVVFQFIGGAPYSRSGWIPFLVGGVLLVAAPLKSWQLFTDPSAAGGILRSTWFQVLLIEAELACGLALWLRFWPHITRGAVMLLFAAFFGSALSQALDGARSCACFGAVQLHPWLAVVLDAAIVVAMFWWKGAPNEPSALGFASALTVLLGTLVIFPVLLTAVDRWRFHSRLHVQSLLDLGTVPKGARQFPIFSVRNPHGHSVVIEHVDASCPCLGGRGLPWVLEPHQHRTVGLALDLARAPEFVGRLSIDVRGVDAGGAVAFVSRVELLVADTKIVAGGGHE